VKIYETCSLEDIEGLSPQKGSQSFLPIVASDLITGLELPSSSNGRTSEGCSLQ